MSLRSVFDEIDLNNDVRIVVWDGPNALAARRAIFDGYKRKDEPTSESVYKNLDLMRELLKLTGVIQIRVPGFEADDVIADLVSRYDVGHIHSNDKDFSALGIPTDQENFKVEPKWVRLYKTTVGDPSDKIPGIKGFGEKAWEACNKEALQKLISLYDERPSWDSPIWTEACIPKKCASWMLDNFSLVQSFWKIVGFLPVPREKIEANTIVGTPNRAGAIAIMQQFLL